MPDPWAVVATKPAQQSDDQWAVKSTRPVATPPTGELRPSTERERFTSSYPVGAKGEGLGENLKNMAQNAGVGIFEGVDALVHPVRTVSGIIDSLNPASSTPNPIQQVYEGLNTRPGEFIPNAAGQAAVMSGAGEVVGPMTRGLMDTVKNARGKAVEAATGTGPGVTADLVKKTQTGNAAADAYSDVRAKVETAREKALKEGNEKYSAVNEKLSHIEADPVTYQGAVSNAIDALRGSKGEPTLLSQMEKKFGRGEVPTYADLQGDYSALGKELSKGTLPGDVFHAYDELHEALGEEMQRIADSQGQGDALKDARNYWRRMKQTFGKPLSSTDAATSTLHAAAPDMAQTDTLANRVRLLGSFDPDIPKAFDRLKAAQEAAKDVPKPVPGETNKVNPEDVREAKGEGLHNRAELVRKVGQRIAKYGVGLKALWDGFHGNAESAGADVLIGAAGYKAAGWIANVLEKPEVVKLLTEPTERDIEQIPPELRGQFPAIIKAAQAKGIKVDPKLAALVGTSSAAVGPHTKRLRELAGTAQ